MLNVRHRTKFCSNKSDRSFQPILIACTGGINTKKLNQKCAVYCDRTKDAKVRKDDIIHHDIT